MLVRESAQFYDGIEVNTTGDGFLLRFDGPARAVRAAQRAAHTVRQRLDVELRAGVHTGEVVLAHNGDLQGQAVHVGARVAALAGPSQVYTTSTVKELTAGSGITFEDA